MEVSVPFTRTRIESAAGPPASELPTRVARAPGLQAATALEPAALRSAVSRGREETTWIFTVFVLVRPRELAAVKETAARPRSRSDGVHSKSPEASSNLAPSGRLATASETGSPWSSVALAVKRAGDPGRAVISRGTRRWSDPDDITIRDSLAESEPERASMETLSCGPSSSVLTSKRKEFHPARPRTVAGVFTCCELLEMAKSAASAAALEL